MSRSSPGPAGVHDDRALPALTGARFVAAAAVVLAHVTEQGLLTGTRGVVDLLDGGRTAVSFFFVLSGFVLAYNYPELRGRSARRAFWVARFARLYPVVLLALVIGAVGTGYAWLHRADGVFADWYGLDHIGAGGLAVGLVAQLSMTVAWFPFAAVASSWDAPAWSISCELFFYALFPLLVAWAARRRTRTLVLATAGAWLLSGAWLALLGTATPEGARRTLLVAQFPPSHLAEFLLGVAAAVLWSRGLREQLAVGHRRELLLAAGLAVVVGVSVWQPVQPVHYLMDPGFTAVVLALAVPPRRRRSWLATRPLVVLGESSFALYLLHVPLLYVARVVGFDGGALPTLALVAVITGVSVVVFRWYETPARRWLRRRLAPAPAAVPG